LLDLEIVRKGLSLSGGDPLHPANLVSILQLVKRVKSQTSKNIWLWTGYTLSELNRKQQEVIKFVDVLIDGKFIIEQKDQTLLWRGSKNQIIHYLT